MKEFENKINPFFWVEYNETRSLCLNVGDDYCMDVFTSREDEGFLGNGYDWESLAIVFLNERMPELIDAIEFDSEAGMFCAYSSNEAAMKNFALKFKELCDDKAQMLDLFSRAELI